MLTSMEALPEAIVSTVTKRETAEATVLRTRAESTRALETTDAGQRKVNVAGRLPRLSNGSVCEINSIALLMESILNIK